MAITGQQTETAEVQLQFETELVTDPIGVDMTVRPAGLAEDVLPEQMLDTAEEDLVGGQGNLVFQAVRVSHGTLRSYGQRSDYDVEPVTESVKVESSRSRRSLEVSWYWTHEAAPYFHFGTSDHTVEGDPLAFPWPDAPDEVREQFEETFPIVFFQSTEPSGIPESRFVTAGRNWLRRGVS
jgi:hypothetical protein